MEAAAYDYFHRIDQLGGMVEAVKLNFPQREIADAAFRYQEQVDDQQRIVVGVNHYQENDEQPLDILRIDPKLEQKQIDRVKAVRARREQTPSKPRSPNSKPPPPATQNLMHPLLDAARAHATEGEIVQTLQTIFGTYTETPVF